MGNSDSDQDIKIGFSAVDIGDSPNGAYLIILSGLPGTGKSYFAKQLSDVVPCVVVSSDRVRKALFVYPKYTRNEHARVFSVCHSIIKSLLVQSYKVVFDATNLNEEFRRPLYKIADEVGCQFTIVAVSSDIDIVTERLRLRMETENPADYSDADINVYNFLRIGRQSILEPHICMISPVDNSHVLKEICNRIERAGSLPDI
ncbi:MAG: hypothetical protein CL886_03995 [Dehalococcoidia bacterium]|nr:hypothetical protein [Dehalococcoidia bacterium]